MGKFTDALKFQIPGAQYARQIDVGPEQVSRNTPETRVASQLSQFASQMVNFGKAQVKMDEAVYKKSAEIHSTYDLNDREQKVAAMKAFKDAGIDYHQNPYVELGKHRAEGDRSAREYKRAALQMTEDHLSSEQGRRDKEGLEQKLQDLQALHFGNLPESVEAQEAFIGGAVKTSTALLANSDRYFSQQAREDNEIAAQERLLKIGDDLDNEAMVVAEMTPEQQEEYLQEKHNNAVAQGMLPGSNEYLAYVESTPMEDAKEEAVENFQIALEEHLATGGDPSTAAVNALAEMAETNPDIARMLLEEVRLGSGPLSKTKKGRELKKAFDKQLREQREEYTTQLRKDKESRVEYYLTGENLKNAIENGETTLEEVTKMGQEVYGARPDKLKVFVSKLTTSVGKGINEDLLKGREVFKQEGLSSDQIVSYLERLEKDETREQVLIEETDLALTDWSNGGDVSGVVRIAAIGSETNRRTGGKVSADSTPFTDQDIVNNPRIRQAAYTILENVGPEGLEYMNVSERSIAALQKTVGLEGPERAQALEKTLDALKEADMTGRDLPEVKPLKMEDFYEALGVDEDDMNDMPVAERSDKYEAYLDAVYEIHAQNPKMNMDEVNARARQRVKNLKTVDIDIDVPGFLDDEVSFLDDGSMTDERKDALGAFLSKSVARSETNLRESLEEDVAQIPSIRFNEEGAERMRQLEQRDIEEVASLSGWGNVLRDDAWKKSFVESFKGGQPETVEVVDGYVSISVTKRDPEKVQWSLVKRALEDPELKTFLHAEGHTYRGQGSVLDLAVGIQLALQKQGVEADIVEIEEALLQNPDPHFAAVSETSDQRRELEVRRDITAEVQRDLDAAPEPTSELGRKRITAARAEGLQLPEDADLDGVYFRHHPDGSWTGTYQDGKPLLNRRGAPFKFHDRDLESSERQQAAFGPESIMSLTRGQDFAQRITPDMSSKDMMKVWEEEVFQFIDTLDPNTDFFIDKYGSEMGLYIRDLYGFWKSQRG